jgi:putative radical SAM enzyme (TIGR03279 family)
MALFQEVDLTTFSGGKITAIEPGSVADDIGLLPGDELLAINDETVEDIIDVQYYGADETFELLIRRGEELLLFEAERDYDQTLGMLFDHPTFDTDIRRCTNLCEFCFVLQMAPRFRRTLYVKDDDYRYSFLFGHFVTLTNLTDHDWWRIENMRLSPLYVSVHVTDLALRRKFLRNENSGDIMAQLRRLIDHGIEVHTQLVVVPGFNDGPWLARSIAELAELWPGVRSISVVPVGLTTHHKYKMRPHTPAEAAVVLDYVTSLQPGFVERFGVRFVYATDEWYLVTGRTVPPLEAYDDQALTENGLGLVRNFLDEWTLLQTEIAEADTAVPLAYNHLTLVTATLFAPTLQETAVRFAELTGTQIDILAVPNRRLGETITVAGLLMGEDVIDYLQEQGYGDLVVLPRVMFDHPDTIALDDLSPQQVANRLERPVALADSMGDVWDALNGRCPLIFYPHPSETLPLEQKTKK